MRAIVVSLFLLTALPQADAQPTPKVWRIGYLDQGSAVGNKLYLEAFRQGLRNLGWIEGETIAVESRFADGKTDQLPSLAAELVRLKVDVIATWTTPAALAAKRATTSIPIVIGFAADPVGTGIVANLARPGGNITGWTHIGFELRAKYLELLKEAVPGATRFGVLWNPTNQVHKPSLKIIEAAAQRLGIELHLLPVQDPKDLERTFSAMVERGVQALVVFPDGMFVAQTAQIIVLAAQTRLPAMYGVREYAAVGGLMTYGANLAEMNRDVGARFVDSILRGANPGELSIAQPTKFELLINLKTATALGLTVPTSLRLRADELIQ